MGSGFKNFTSTVLTAADLNNYCQTQSIMYFSSTGARDASVTAPVAGMTAYVDSADVNEGLYSYTGGRWNRGPSWNAPWGIVAATAGGTIGLGYAVVTSAQASITTQVDLTGLSITFSTLANRMYRINAHCDFFSNTASDTANLFLVRDGTNIAIAHSAALGTSSSDLRSVPIMRPFIQTAAASVTVKLAASRQTGTGSLTMHAGATNVASMVIEDIGPAGAPA
jgi:hypothetical protein